MDAAERARIDEIAFKLAGILDTGITAEQAREALEFIDGIKQAARLDERRKVLEEAAKLADEAIASNMHGWGEEFRGSRKTARRLAKKMRALAEEVT